MVSGPNHLISERELAATVDALAELHGWKIFGVLEQRVYARRLSRGFPDRVMTRAGRLLFVEYKSQAGEMGPGQQDWLDALSQCRAPEGYRVGGGVEVYLWRPSDLDSIEEILK